MHKIIIPILHPRKNNLFKNKEGLILDIFTKDIGLQYSCIGILVPLSVH